MENRPGQPGAPPGRLLGGKRAPCPGRRRRNMEKTDPVLENLPGRVRRHPGACRRKRHHTPGAGAGMWRKPIQFWRTCPVGCGATPAPAGGKGAMPQEPAPEYGENRSGSGEPARLGAAPSGRLVPEMWNYPICRALRELRTSLIKGSPLRLSKSGASL